MHCVRCFLSLLCYFILFSISFYFDWMLNSKTLFFVNFLQLQKTRHWKGSSAPPMALKMASHGQQTQTSLVRRHRDRCADLEQRAIMVAKDHRKGWQVAGRLRHHLASRGRRRRCFLKLKVESSSWNQNCCTQIGLWKETLLNLVMFLAEWHHQGSLVMPLYQPFDDPLSSSLCLLATQWSFLMLLGGVSSIL